MVHAMLIARRLLLTLATMPLVGALNKARLPTNAAGPLFVDASCINCDTCRWMAPSTFGHANAKSYVHAQPDEATKTAALRNTRK